MEYTTVNGTEYKVRVVDEGDRLYKKFRYKTVTLKVIDELWEQDYDRHSFWESVGNYVENEK